MRKGFLLFALWASQFLWTSFNISITTHLDIVTYILYEEASLPPTLTPASHRLVFRITTKGYKKLDVINQRQKFIEVLFVCFLKFLRFTKERLIKETTSSWPNTTTDMIIITYNNSWIGTLFVTTSCKLGGMLEFIPYP